MAVGSCAGGDLQRARGVEDRDRRGIVGADRIAEPRVSVTVAVRLVPICEPARGVSASVVEAGPAGIVTLPGSTA